MSKNCYIITEGDPDREEPAFICAVSDDNLEPTLKQCADDIIRNKGDVTTLRVWKLTPIEVTTKAFEILNMAKR